MNRFFVFLTLVFIFSIEFTNAQIVNQGNVVINEVNWVGSINSANDEWIELKNNTDQDINLDGWILKATDGTPEIKLTGIISANGFYLMERTDDSTVPAITADLIYKGALSNKGEDLWLYDGNNNLIDEVNGAEKWLAGDNVTKQTMEKSPTGWQTSKDVGGTPKSQNSTSITLPLFATGGVIEGQTKPTSVKEDTPELTQSQIIQTYPKGVVFNEILPSPDGLDEENEWIELYNTNNTEVNLSGWKIKDKEGSITNYSLPENTKILAYGYLVFKRPDTKITLNNTTDGLMIYWPNEKIVDSITYEKALPNQSYNKIGTNWQWSAFLTPGAKNIISQGDVKQKRISSSQARAEDLPKIKKFGSNKEIDTGLAAVSQLINQEKIKNTNPWFLFLMALVITILSAIIVLFIKFKFRARDSE